MAIPLALEHSCGGTNLDNYLLEEIEKPFDLACGPLLRISAFREGPEHCILLIVIHHIVADGWSMGVLFGDLAEFYNAELAKRPPSLRPLPIQYGDFADWQRGWLQGEELERQLRFWISRLKNAPASLAIPTDRPRALAARNRGGWYRHPIAREVGRDLRAIGQAEGATLFMVLLSVFAALLSRRSGLTDIVIGAPSAGRSRSQLEGLIGFFVNTLPLRVDLSGNPNPTELLLRVKQVALDAFAHQDLPFEKLVEVLRPARQRGVNPLVQCLFAFHNQPSMPLQLDGIDVETSVINTGSAKFDLSLHAAEEESGVVLAFSYNADLFDELTIAGLAEEYEALARAWVATPKATDRRWAAAGNAAGPPRLVRAPRKARGSAASGSWA